MKLCAMLLNYKAFVRFLNAPTEKAEIHIKEIDDYLKRGVL